MKDREEWMALFLVSVEGCQVENDALGASRVLFLAAGSLFDHKDSIKFEDYVSDRIRWRSHGLLSFMSLSGVQPLIKGDSAECRKHNAVFNKAQ